MAGLTKSARREILSSLLTLRSALLTLVMVVLAGGFAAAAFVRYSPGFDIDEKKVTDMESGRSYIFRIPEEEIQAAQKKGLRATTDFSRLSDMDAIIMCVPTPLTGHREPDLSFIENTARAVAPWLREGQLVVLESTTYWEPAVPFVPVSTRFVPDKVMPVI